MRKTNAMKIDAAWEHNPDRTLWLYVEPEDPNKYRWGVEEQRKLYGLVTLWRRVPGQDINRLAFWYSTVEGRDGHVHRSLAGARLFVENHWKDKGDESDERSGDVPTDSP